MVSLSLSISHTHDTCHSQRLRRLRQTDRQTDRQTQTDTDRHRQTQTDRDRDRDRDRDTDRHRHRHRHRQRQTDRQTETDRDRQTAVTLKSSSLHCGVSHRRSAKERRAQRSRAEARFIGRILRGCFELATHRGAKAGDIISSLADNLRGRQLTKREHKEMYQQTDPDSPVILVSAATRTEEPEPSVFVSSVETGTTPCTVAENTQIVPLCCPAASCPRRSYSGSDCYQTLASPAASARAQKAEHRCYQ